MEERYRNNHFLQVSSNNNDTGVLFLALMLYLTFTLSLIIGFSETVLCIFSSTGSSFSTLVDIPIETGMSS